MGILGFPLALLALTALPVLGGIYWLRNRFRPRVVSSLILWIDHNRAKEGGRRVQRIQAPLIFFIELLTIALLVIAAAGPMLPSKDITRHLIVVLDDSYSMRAGGLDSVREAGIEEVIKEIQRYGNVRVQFVVAADRPQIMGAAVRNEKEARQLLGQWQCESAQADIGKAILLANELARQWSDILVLTDHQPEGEVEENGNVEWRALGRKLPNIAIVNASRNVIDARERLMLEVANTGESSCPVNLIIETQPDSSAARSLKQQKLTLKPRQSQRIILDLHDNVPIIRARIEQVGNDGLLVDDKVVLVSEKKAPLRVSLSVGNVILRENLIKALEACASAKIVKSDPELIFTDKIIANPTVSDIWHIHMAIESDAVSYAGPFILDKTHPLIEGISLEGVVWAAGKSKDKIEGTAQAISGRSVILAGNVPLMIVDRKFNGAVNILVRLHMERSTLQDSANWPILVSNILQWCTAEKSGPNQRNYRLGSTISIRPGSRTETIDIEYPDGYSETTDVSDAVFGELVNIYARQSGLYTVTATSDEASGDKKRTSTTRWELAVNTLNLAESDLSPCCRGNWGNWKKSEHTIKAYHNTAWFFLLLAMTMLLVHMVLLARQSGGH